MGYLGLYMQALWFNNSITRMVRSGKLSSLTPYPPTHTQMVMVPQFIGISQTSLGARLKSCIGSGDPILHEPNSIRSSGPVGTVFIFFVSVWVDFNCFGSRLDSYGPDSDRPDFFKGSLEYFFKLKKRERERERVCIYQKRSFFYIKDKLILEI